MARRKQASAWEIQQYQIHAVVTGRAYGESGLGYHCDYDVLVEGLSGGKQWVVDHLASGQAIAAFNAQARAQFLVELIAHYTNWNESAEVLSAQEDLWERVRVAVRQAAQWKPEQANKLLQLKQQLILRGKREPL